MLCSECRAETVAGELRVDETCRLEGVSDPDDMMLVVAAICPACQSKATLVLSYGPTTSDEDADVLAQLPTG